MTIPHSKLRPRGGYRRLRSFQVAEIIYDGTVAFCDRFVSKRSRTHDQMVQAARSGRQNIAEGSRASATSSKTELKLVNVARASLEELLLDYEDFLRQRGLPPWGKGDAQALAVRAVGQKNPTDPSDQTNRTDATAYSGWLDHADPAVVANALICLIHQANYLLDRQISGLERQFVQEGGTPTGYTPLACRSGRSRIGPIPLIRPTSRKKPARLAESPSCCARPARDQKPAPDSGAAQAIPSAGQPCRCTRTHSPQRNRDNQ